MQRNKFPVTLFGREYDVVVALIQPTSSKAPLNPIPSPGPGQPTQVNANFAGSPLSDSLEPRGFFGVRLRRPGEIEHVWTTVSHGLAGRIVNTDLEKNKQYAMDSNEMIVDREKAQKLAEREPRKAAGRATFHHRVADLFAEADDALTLRAQARINRGFQLPEGATDQLGTILDRDVNAWGSTIKARSAFQGLDDLQTTNMRAFGWERHSRPMMLCVFLTRRCTIHWDILTTSCSSMLTRVRRYQQCSHHLGALILSRPPQHRTQARILGGNNNNRPVKLFCPRYDPQFGQFRTYPGHVMRRQAREALMAGQAYYFQRSYKQYTMAYLWRSHENDQRDFRGASGAAVFLNDSRAKECQVAFSRTSRPST